MFYKRYIDDTFILFKDKSHARLFLNYLKSQHNNINFTMETKQNRQLPFLVKRKPNILSTSINQKPTFSGLGLSYFCYTPFIYRINSIKNLISRVYMICSNYSLFHAELHFLRTYFCNNGYPRFLFEIVLVNICPIYLN